MKICGSRGRVNEVGENVGRGGDVQGHEMALEQGGKKKIGVDQVSLTD